MKTALLKERIRKERAKGRRVFIAGESIHEDKAPERLVMGDVKLMPFLPRGFVPGSLLVPARDFIPYEVADFRRAAVIKEPPAIQNRGMANDGNFSGILQFLGYSIAGADEALDRKRIVFRFYWKALQDPPGDYLGTLLMLDGQYRKLRPESTTGYFTPGGLYPVSQWKKGLVIEDEVYYYPPALRPGKYYLALGLVDRESRPLPYVPGSPGEGAKKYDFMLLAPLSF